MEILKFEGGAPRGRAKSSSNKKSIRVAVAVGAVALVAVLSSTLAANISINTGGSVEFGQGLSAAAACDSTLTLTPSSKFVNGNGITGNFYVGSILVYDSSTSSNSTGIAACGGKYIRLAGYDSSTATPLTLASGGGSGWTTIELYIATGTTGIEKSYLASPGASGLNPTAASVGSSYPVLSTSAGKDFFNVNLGTGTGVATAGQVYKITVESHS
jgi:hypothetical protein